MIPCMSDWWNEKYKDLDQIYFTIYISVVSVQFIYVNYDS